LDLQFYVKPTKECQDSAIHYLIFTTSMPSESDIQIHIHSATSQVSRFVSGYNICN